MKPDEYKYLEDTLTGRRQRDPAYEAKLRDVINPKTAERQRQIDSMTHEERELEQREFSLKVYGRENMLRYAHPIISDRPLGALQVPGDLIRDVSQARGHNGEVSERKSASSQQQLKVHSGGETPEPWQNPDGSLRLQTHGAIKQVLQLM